MPYFGFGVLLFIVIRVCSEESRGLSDLGRGVLLMARLASSICIACMGGEGLSARGLFIVRYSKIKSAYGMG